MHFLSKIKNNAIIFYNIKYIKSKEYQFNKLKFRPINISRKLETNIESDKYLYNSYY